MNKTRHVGWALALILISTGAGSVPAAGWDEEDRRAWRVSGHVALEARGFSEGGAYPGQSDGGEGSWTLVPELDFESREGTAQVRVVPFLRVDGTDDHRTHYDLREAYWRRRWERWELTAGFNRVFWGVAESRHLVDVINQTDLVEDIDGEDKLGQPMVHVATDRAWGRLEGFVLTGFRERSYPGAEGRLRTGHPVDDDAAVFESGAGRGRIDAALRWSHYFGDWDVGVHGFQGTGREPRLLPDAEGQRLVPHYDVVRQGGVDVQYTRNAWLFKLEALARTGQGDTFAAAVAGFEYTFYQVGGRAADVGLLVEVLRDERDAYAPPTIYDDDLFVGSRLAINDAFDTQILAGAILDRNDHSIAGFLEAGRRVGSRFTVELEARWFADVAPANTLYPLKNDSHVTLRVSRYF